jgi:CRP-like cAMP-binding protein
MEEYLKICRDTLLFSSLSDEDWRRLNVWLPKPVSFCANEELMNKSPALVILLSGRASVFAISHGRNAVTRTLGKGDVFGVATIFGDNPPVSIVKADTTCRCLVIPRETVLQFMQESFAFTEAYLRFLTDRICFLNRRIGNYSEDSAEERLLYYLQEGADENGVFTLVSSMSVLAQTLHIGRSSLYRAFETLIKQDKLAQINHKQWKIKEVLL